VLAATLVLSPPPAGADDAAAAQARANRAAADLSKAEAALGRLDQQVEDLAARHSEARRQLDEMRAAVREAVLAQLIRGDTEMLSLASDDPTDQAVASTLAQAATGYSSDAIDRYIAVADDAERVGKELRARRSELADAVDELRSRRDQVEAELTRIEAARAANAAAGRTSRTRRVGQGGAPIATGNWVCPVQGPVAFSDSWGAPRSGGRSHTGVDMLSPRGTPTVAPVTGRVVHKESGLGGLTWYVYGDDGNTYYGAHLSAYENQGIGRVQAGTVIGYIGDSGNAKGTNHLHFQIKPAGGAPTNPYPTVRRFC
jgi:murein DD-endopeptidase MepM/ murein hydrolase activator NlpD